jgi:hypothetical protein
VGDRRWPLPDRGAADRVSLGHHLGQVRRYGWGPTHRAPDPLDDLEAVAADIAAFGFERWPNRIREIIERLR